MRFRFLACALMTLSSLASGADRPNIIIIVADDLGYGDIGVHGCRDIPTPQIDSLAANGVRCTDGYVSGPYCSPTRAGLLTGRYQQRFGHEFNPGGQRTAVENDRLGLPLSQKTLPQLLKSAGYETAMVGKWHLGSSEAMHPLSRGFDSFVGFLGGAHPYIKPRGRNTTRPANARQPILLGREPFDQYEYLTDLFGARAADFIRRKHDKPFFLYLTFNAVHTPMHATPAKLAQFAHIKDEKRRSYAAMLSSMDDAIGAVLKALGEAKIEDNTLIFFISDNGGPEQANASDNGPLLGGKATTWEGGIRVPFMVQWKGRLPVGTTYSRPVIQLDIFTTAITAAEVDAREIQPLDGVDLVPHLSGKSTATPHDNLYWRFGRQMAIRQGDWKLVRAGSTRDGDDDNATTDQIEGSMLFNLSIDAGEQRNVADQNPEIVKRLTQAWQDWNKQLAEPLWEAPKRRRQ